MQPSPDPFTPVVSWLINNGVLGIVCVMLLFAMRVIYNERVEMQKKNDDCQAQRLAQQEEIVRALVDSTRVMHETTDALNARRR